VFNFYIFIFLLFLCSATLPAVVYCRTVTLKDHGIGMLFYFLVERRTDMALLEK